MVCYSEQMQVGRLVGMLAEQMADMWVGWKGDWRAVMMVGAKVETTVGC